MKILFFDDDPDRHAYFDASISNALTPADDYRAFTIQEAITHLEESQQLGIPFDWAFLDHDLDGEVYVEQRERTGQIVADYIAQMPPSSRPKRVLIHSYNPKGALEMQRILQEAGVQAERASFALDEFQAALSELN